jgi:predicted aspartyl protease
MTRGDSIAGSTLRICMAVAMMMGPGLLPAAETEVHSAPLDIAHDKPFVMVMVNGKGPFRFVIDTGTGGEAFVTRELAAQLGLPVTGQVRLSDPSGQGAQRAPIVSIQSLKVAGVEFTAVKAVEHSLSEQDGECEGLLGFRLFRDFLLTIDFPNRRMMLASGALAPDGGQNVLPFRMPEGIPIVAMQIDGMSVDAQVDSGGAGLSLPEHLVSKLKFASVPAAFSNSESLSTRFQIKAAKLDADARLGGYTFLRPFVEINPAFPLANFGASPMHSFAVTFDQKNGLIRFDARQKSIRLAATPMPVRMQNQPLPKSPNPLLVPVG